MSDLDIHVQRLQQTYSRFREDFAKFFHQISKTNASALPGQFPCIHYGHVLASLKIFESNDDFVQVDSIVTTADTLMARYISDYEIDATAGYCHMKYVYFVGMAFARKLRDASEIEHETIVPSVRSDSLRYASKIVMVTMISYLDRFLELKGIQKDSLKAAMTRLVRDDRFDREMGEIGCYLVYKCVSTTPTAHTTA